MIPTEKKIEIMNQYNNGANILLRKIGAPHWINAVEKDNIQFSWSTNEYKTKKDFSEAVIEYVRNVDFSSLPNATNLKSECLNLLTESLLVLDVNKIVIKQSEHFFINIMDTENEKVTVGIYYFSQKFNFAFEVDDDDAIIDSDRPGPNSIQLLTESEYQALPDELKNNGTTYLTY